MSASAVPASGGPLERRAADLESLRRDRFDVLVVGGGITGAGTVLDAASRGLRAGLVERDDLGSGTSSRSSKLIHGGLRYLEQYRFGLVREALAERATLGRIAPHLVHLEPFTVPLHGSPLQVPWMGAGLALYGFLGAGRPTFLGPGRVRRRFPALRTTGLRGAFVYHDGVADDARLVTAVARTAIGHGATVVTRVSATGLRTVHGRTAGLEAIDLVTGEAFGIAADRVVDATGATGGPGGPFAEHAGRVAVAPSLGIHLVVPRERIAAAGGLTIRVPGRVIFLVPWGRCWIIGTTDHPYDGPTDRPAAPGAAVAEVLAAVQGAMDVSLQRADLLATYAGIRPLAATPDGSTVTASREHVISEPVPGLLSVRGGKYTTYRLIAAEVVDRALGTRARTVPSITATLRLVGAPDPGADAVRAATVPGVDPASLAALRARHGTDTDAVLALGRRRGLLGRLHPDADHLEAEVAWAAERELALSLDDVLARRLRSAIETRDHGVAVAPRVAAIMGPTLGWDAARQAAEVERYAVSALREYGVP